MTTTVKERIKTELQQAKVEGKQRATRISDILKNAASMTFEEVKEGSSNLHVSARRSIAEILEELKETPEATTDATNETVATSAEDVETNTAGAAPSWKTIVSHALEIVRDRKGDWLHALQKHLAENAGKLDQDLTSQHGDRYLNVKQIFKRLINRVKAAQANTGQASRAGEEPSQPVIIEVIDSDTPTDSTTVRRIEPEA